MQLKLDIEELNKLLGSATRQRSRDVITLELQKLQIELAKQYESSNASSVKPRPSQNTGAKVYDVKLNNYCWDQSNKFVKLYITLNNVQNLTKESVACNFTNRSLDLRVLNLENRNYQLPINNLCEEIIPEESYVKVKNDMIVVFLAKKSQTNWSHVTNVEKKIKVSLQFNFFYFIKLCSVEKIIAFFIAKFNNFPLMHILCVSF